MLKRVVAIFIVLAAAFWLSPAFTHAQDPEPAVKAFNDLVGAGYDVIEIDAFPDAQGNPDPTSIYALIETVTTDLNDSYIQRQVLRGFRTLYKYFPTKQNFIVVLRYDRWLYFFATNPADWDDVVAERVALADFWKVQRAQVRIYDAQERKYVTEKDFLNILQTNKNQTNKDFSGTAKNPLPPINTNPNAEAENIALEPSTTFLPADGTTEAFLLASLTDNQFAGLPTRGVNFAFQVRGQDERALPTAQTDQFGTARSKIASSRHLDLVLLRASTATLNATGQIIVGTPPGNNVKAQEQAVIEGLNSQGYLNADAAFLQATGPTGQVFRQGLAAVRVTSKGFDREVYSQLFRMMGTVRTVMPSASFLRPILLYAAADGHDYSILFSMRADIWDAYIRGDIGENQLWSNLNYDGAVNENGVRVNDKDFLSKNFTGSKQPRVSNVSRTVESTLTTEEWGEQLTVGSFLVPVGGYADTFRITELTDSANGFAIYETPNYNSPVFTFTRGNEAALSALRLDAGQFIVAVNGSRAPAKIVLEFVEHLVR